MTDVPDDYLAKVQAEIMESFERSVVAEKAAQVCEILLSQYRAELTLELGFPEDNARHTADTKRMLGEFFRSTQVPTPEMNIQSALFLFARISASLAQASMSGNPIEILEHNAERFRSQQ